MATAAIGIGASLLSGVLGSKGAKKAAAAQSAAYDKALAQQQGQFNQTQANFQPYLSGGGAALGSINDILGMNGNDPQAAAIAALKGSPGFTSQYNTGVDTILQNSAATGGLRGGNTQNSLAQFGSGLLAQVIQNQLGSLGGLANMGMGAAGNIGQFGQANSSAVSGLLGQQGNAQASGILGQYGSWMSALQGAAGSAGGLFGGMGGLGSKGGGLTDKIGHSW